MDSSNGPVPAGKPAGGRLADGRRESRTEKPPSPDTHDGDAETSPFAGRGFNGSDRTPEPSYVMPEPAVKALSPTREVLAVIGNVGPVHLDYYEVNK